jgi:HlyD family secretion protein
VHVIADVDETDIGRVKIGLGARVTPDAYPGREFTGTVMRVAPLAKVEQNVTMFEVTIVVDNQQGLLKAGMNADVEMVIDQALDVVLVPVGAVQTRIAGPGGMDGPRGENDNPSAENARAHSSDENPSRPGGRNDSSGDDTTAMAPGDNVPELYVEVINGGQVVERPVKVGLANLDEVQIIEGVAPGDSLQWSLTSGALAGREQFRERMRSRSAVPGMRSR